MLDKLNDISINCLLQSVIVYKNIMMPVIDTANPKMPKRFSWMYDFIN